MNQITSLLTELSFVNQAIKNPLMDLEAVCFQKQNIVAELIKTANFSSSTSEILKIIFYVFDNHTDAELLPPCLKNPSLLQAISENPNLSLERSPQRTLGIGKNGVEMQYFVDVDADVCLEEKDLSVLDILLDNTTKKQKEIDARTAAKNEKFYAGMLNALSKIQKKHN